jgi:NifU-like protein
MIKGKTVDEALAITNRDIADYLGGLPEEKMHCSVMGREALEAAIADYRGEELAHEKHDEGEIVCRCFGVTDEKIKRAIRENNLTTVEQVTNYTKAGGGCTACVPKIEDLLREVRGEARVAELTERALAPRKLTNIQKIMMIQDAIENDIAPGMRADGGGIELVDVEGNLVSVRLTGHCVDCPSSEFTLKLAVEQKLRDVVSPEIVVEEVTP